jgi:murein L,D-transpeptidase YafK
MTKPNGITQGLIFIFAFVLHANLLAQGNSVNYQKTIGHQIRLAKGLEDSVKKQFQQKNIAYPPVEMYLRSFKYERELELWVKDKQGQPFKLFKSYKVCQQSGTMGPKRMEGDFQVPEGFYYINEFNPNSNYHLSLGLNYPNASDKILSDSTRPGSAIYIHGSCVSVGCIPIDNMPIEEVYLLANYTKSAGQEFIPVHIYPVKFNNKKSVEYLNKTLAVKPTLKYFSESLKAAYTYFEANKELPVVLVNKNGDYVVAN